MTTRDRRALVLGSTLVALAWLATRGLPAGLRELERLEVSAEQRADLVGRARARMADLPRLTDSLTMLEGVADSLSAMLLSGIDPAGSQVDLMNRIRTRLEEEPVTIRAFEPAAAADSASSLELAGVIVSVETDFRGLLNTAWALAHDPALAIDAVEVSAGDAHAEQESIERLSARIAVTGWYRPSGQTPEEPDS